MRAFLFGALLVQTLSAQGTDESATAVNIAITDVRETPAPLIIPGPNALSEAELSSQAAAAGAGADTTVDASSGETTPFAEPDFVLPIGTADVIFDSISSQGLNAFQATTDAAPSFNGTALTSPMTSSLEPTPTPELDPNGANSLEPDAPQTLWDEFGNPITIPAPGTSTGPTTPFGAQAVSETSSLVSEPTMASELPANLHPQPTMSPSTPGSNLTGLATPTVLTNISAPETSTSPGLDAQDYDAGNRPGGSWRGPDTWDNGNYDGQDYTVDEEDSADIECPWWCLPDYYKNNEEHTGEDGTDYPADNSSEYSPEDGTGYPADDDTGYPVVRRPARRALRARQSSGGFVVFNWPDASDDSVDGEDTYPAGTDTTGVHTTGAGDLSSCPAICSVDTYPGTEPTMTRSRTWGSYSTPTESYTPVTNSTTSYYCGYGDSSPYCNHDETTSTSTITDTTLVTLTSTTPYFTSTPSAYPDSDSDQSWTGDTIAGICPKTCNPFYPNLNFCDITTSCTTTGGPNNRYYCACRAGYRSSKWNPKDFSKQFHVPGQPYVYVAAGVVCDEVCVDQTCAAVLVRPKCL
ncbi:hypothetical protein BDW02DRAFT_572930 [Decorospora gaudefroyi]|uniref:EGF-like domain-containing protein n=1 Tax=Decorospora gaudefroyi TaxID=184978 RepID=A0A6A5K374_9PLEO|nr:hypothetical protein BDW02DRAFT_572930 [Decorospora gaudefroyi]